jgi:MOSC domain-containing protein
MHVSALAIYPVKGCHRVEVAEAEVQPWGLAADRRWLVVDARTGVAITMRDTTRLTHIFPEVQGDDLVLRMVGFGDLKVPAPAGAPLIDVKVGSSTIAAMTTGAAVDEWLSSALELPVRLVWLDDPTRRSVKPAYSQPTDRVSFADGFPVSLANTASLAALNDLILESDPMQAPVPITRFRSNIVVSGGPAWVEDEWTGRRIRIGEVVFRVAKPNDRCVVTTIDMETGEKFREPLRTLGRFRNVDQELLFATLLIPDTPGTIAIGAPVAVL